MHQSSPDLPRLLGLTSLDDFDTVGPADVEACRRAFDYTASEFAEQLGWSTRKYARMLEAASEVDFVERDVALAVRGLANVLLGSDDRTDMIALGQAGAWRMEPDASFLGGRVFSDILPDLYKHCGEWTADVAPSLLLLITARAAMGKRITYGEAATTLEEAGLTHRVWPRTLYGFPLGVACRAMMELSQRTDIRVPLISTIVVKGSGAPGSGLDPMIKLFIKQHESSKRARELLTRLKRDRESLVGELQQEVFSFQHWSGVIHALGLKS